MKIKLFFLAIFSLSASLAFGVYTPLTISSGFNADVIANGVGSGLTTTNNDIDGVNYCYVSNGWQVNSSASGITTGLPSNGTINSALTTGLSFQLASYTGNNDLRLPSNNTSGTLTFQTPTAAQTLYLLAVTGSGSSTMTVQINFADLTSQTSSSITVSDWYGGANVALTGFQRLNRMTDLLDNAFNGPNLYQYSIAISAANQSKQITSILVTRTSGTGTETTLNIMAVTVDAPAVTCPAPSALSAGSITTTGAELNWTENGSASQWQLEYGLSGFTQGSGTAVYTSTKPYSLSSLSVSTAYDFYVRAICGAGDSSTWTGPFTFSTACVPPALLSQHDSSRCGNGTVYLTATADPGASLKWYAEETGGVALGTGSPFITPNLTETDTFYVAAAGSLAGCESVRQPVVATVFDLPLVNIGKDTTICPGITYTLNAGNPGADYLWSNNATSQTINVTAQGTYFVKVTDAHSCQGSDTIIITPGIVAQNNLIPAIDLCEGSSATLNAGNPGFDFDWNTAETSQAITVSSGGNYSVAITSSDGCILNCSTDVTMRPLPVVDLGPDTSICPNASLTLDAGNAGATYSWNSGAVSQTVQTTDSGTYFVTVTSPYNCVSSDEKHISFLVIAHTDGFNFIPLFYEELGKVKFEPVNAVDVMDYTWDFGDGTPVGHDTFPTHTYTQSGVYHVTLRVSNGCGQTELSLPISVDLTTGIVTINGENAKLKLYPNPARNVITIENEGSFSMQKISVFNTLGREVYQQTLTSEKKQTVDISGLTNGLYFARILTNKGWLIHRFEIMR